MPYVVREDKVIRRIVKKLNDDYLGFSIEEGDIIMIKTSHRSSDEKYIFRGFNTHLYAFILEDENGNTIYLPLSQVKKLTKLKEAEKSG
jgi:DNA-binding Lrp family transcriptional regulator